MAIADSFFLDSGISYYSETGFDDLAGLWHLEGETVTVLADGVVYEDLTVANGHVALPVTAYKVHVGLPYNADAQTLPTVLERVAALGQANKSNVNKVVLRVKNSAPVMIGPDFDTLVEYNASDPETEGTDAYLHTGHMDVVIDPQWSDDVRICIRQDKPLPLELLSLSLDVAKGG
jgi:hypothetical protein